MLDSALGACGLGWGMGTEEDEAILILIPLP